MLGKISIKKLSIIILGYLLFFANKSFAASPIFGAACPAGAAKLNCWLGDVFNWALIVVASVAIVAIMAGGVLYITAGGSPDQIKTAKKIITNALIGVAVLVLADIFMKRILGVPWIR